jgi:hypothetical protein
MSEQPAHYPDLVHVYAHNKEFLFKKISVLGYGLTVYFMMLLQLLEQM